MRVVVNTLSLFCGQSGAKADQTNPAILARWGMPPRPSVGSPPRSRRRWNCNSIYRAGLPFSSAGPVPSSPPGKSGNRSFALAPPARQPD
jgi:hypothetical protein